MLRFRNAAAALALLGTLALPATSAAAVPRFGPTAPVRLLTCAGKATLEPAEFVISCADGNSELTKTHWQSWSSTRAAGTTRFGLNLCEPNCASSRMSFFPGSKVTLSRPVLTRKHGRLFSQLSVSYKLHGKVEHFDMSWKGTPAFS